MDFLLGFQILIGGITSMTGLYLGLKAFSYDAGGGRSDVVFASYLAGGFLLVGIGTLLIFLIFITAPLVL